MGLISNIILIWYDTVLAILLKVLLSQPIKITYKYLCILNIFNCSLYHQFVYV